MSEDIRHAGFYGEVSNVINLPPGSVIPLPASLPNPCDTAIANVAAALSLPIQGVDNATAGSCLPDYVAGTDAFVIRRSNTQTIAAGTAAANGYYTQVAFCATAVPIFKIAQSGFTLQGKDCATTMPVRQYHVYIYYIASCSIGTGTGGACQAGDPAIPTLKRAELATGGSITVTPLVEGIENMQIEYGLDTTVPADGSPDTYTANPTTVAQWAQVVAMRLHLLARNTEVTPGFTDTKTYQLGLKADGTANNVAPGGGYRRHEYTELVRVQNVSQRVEPVFGINP
jgi:type IV pilus assembly protein PilW